MIDLEELKKLKKFNCNGYYMYYLPNHHLANKTGTVYEHMLVAEAMLGRELKAGEEVHHKDENRKNNSPTNLMVFKSNADHTAYHGGCDIVLDGDVYVAIRKNRKSNEGKSGLVDTCPFCGGEKNYQATMCINCWNKYKSKNIPSKAILRDLILNYTMVAIGKMYNVSDNAVRNWCKKYNLPYRRKEINMLKQQSSVVDR